MSKKIQAVAPAKPAPKASKPAPRAAKPNPIAALEAQLAAALAALEAAKAEAAPKPAPKASKAKLAASQEAKLAAMAADKPAAKARAAKAATNPDAIIFANFSKTENVDHGRDLVVTSADGQTVRIDGNRLSRELNKLAVLGASMARVKEALASQVQTVKPKLAEGVTARTAPQSAAAVASQPATAKPAKASQPKPATVKAARQPAATSTDPRKIQATDLGKAKLASGAATNAVRELSAMVAAGTVQQARAAGLGMSAINYAVRTGTIILA